MVAVAGSVPGAGGAGVPRSAVEPVPVSEFAAGTWSEVLEAQRSSTVEQIVVHQGVPMGPRGEVGPTGPTGAKGESTEWTVGVGVPPAPTVEDEVGEIWMDVRTGDVWVLTLDGWVMRGNILGPTGPTGPIGEPIRVRVGSVFPGGFGEASVLLEEDPAAPYWALHFVVPEGPTGPLGPPPEVVVGHVEGVGPDEPPRVDFDSSNGLVKLDFWLQQGPTGPVGTNIRVVGSWPVGGPPDGSGNDGDGVVDSGGHVWVWSAVAGVWVDVGPVVGPVGPTGPVGPGFRVVEFDLGLTDAGDGTGVQVVRHALSNPYPLVRVLLDGGGGVLVDAQSVGVSYVSPSEVRVVMDNVMVGREGKVVLM